MTILSDIRNQITKFFIVLILLSPNMLNGQKDSSVFSPFKVLESKLLKSNLSIFENDTTKLVLDSILFLELKNNLSKNLKMGITSSQSTYFELIENDLFIDGLNIKSSSGNYIPRNNGRHFSGTINNNQNSIVAISIYQNGISGFFSVDSKNYSINKLRNSSNVYYIIEDNYSLDPLALKNGCDGINSNFDPVKLKDKFRSNIKKSNANSIIGIYIECDHNMFNDFGSVTRAANKTLELFNIVFCLYKRDFTEFNLRISEIKVWDTDDPYNAESPITIHDLLTNFETELPSYEGRIAHLLTTSDNDFGGKASDVLNVLDQGSCPYPENIYAVSDIEDRDPSTSLDSDIYDEFSYSWPIYVISHEMGHQLGSPHTHACKWDVNSNGSFQQIDDCGNVFFTSDGLDNNNNGTIDDISEAEGELCFTQSTSIIPSSGTIMSYCHLNGFNGIDFSVGFDNLVKNQIISFVNCLDLSVNNDIPLLGFKYKNSIYDNCRGFRCDQDRDEDLEVFEMNGKILNWSYLGNGAIQQLPYDPPLKINNGNKPHIADTLTIDTRNPTINETTLLSSGKLPLGHGLHVFQVESWNGQTEYFGVILGNHEGWEGCGWAAGCTEEGTFILDNNFIKKSNISASALTNLNYTISNCNSSNYDANISFSGPSSSYHFQILYTDGSSTQLNNVLPNGTFANNTIHNIPYGVGAIVNIIDENDNSCQDNTIIIDEQECVSPPNSLTHTCNLSTGTAIPNEIVIANGVLTYNDGTPMINGSITVSIGSNVYNTSTNNSGDYSISFSAPNNTTNIVVTATDGNFTNACSNILTIQSGNSGPGFQLVDHRIAHGIDNNFFYVNEDYYWESVDSRLHSWVELINVTNNAVLEWRFIRPDGIQYTQPITHTVSNQNGGGYYAYAYIDIAGEPALSYPGRWSVEVWGNVAGAPLQKLLADRFFLSYELKRYTMCGDFFLDQNNAPHPLDEKNTYYTNEDFVNHWVEFQNVTEFVDMRFQFIEPNGNVYSTVNNADVPHPANSGFDWWDYYHRLEGLGISGNPMANKTGNWKVKVQGKLLNTNWKHLYTDNFQLLESPNVKPVASVVVNNQNPTEADNIVITYSATDNTYLKRIDKHYRINGGNWQTAAINNLNKNNWSGNENLGQRPVGTTIDYYTTAIDNSGNVCSSDIGTVYVQDDDFFPPDISNITASEYNGNNDGSIDDLEQFEICADISDETGISSVEFSIDGVQYNLTTNYCVIAGPLSSGNHTISITATDSDNSPMSSTVSSNFFISDSCPYDLIVNNNIDPIYESENSITTNGNVDINVGGQTEYKSNSIILKPGMHAKSGSVFHAHVDPCNN